MKLAFTGELAERAREARKDPRDLAMMTFLVSTGEKPRIGRIRRSSRERPRGRSAIRGGSDGLARASSSKTSYHILPNRFPELVVRIATSKFCGEPGIYGIQQGIAISSQMVEAVPRSFGVIGSDDFLEHGRNREAFNLIIG